MVARGLVTGDGQREILSGVAVGDVVVVQGAIALQDGLSVDVTAPAAPPAAEAPAAPGRAAGTASPAPAAPAVPAEAQAPTAQPPAAPPGGVK